MNEFVTLTIRVRVGATTITREVRIYTDRPTVVATNLNEETVAPGGHVHVEIPIHFTIEDLDAPQ